MQFSHFENSAVADNWTRSQLRELSTCPSNHVTKGKRFKFQLTSASIAWVRDTFPDAEYADTFPKPAPNGTSQRGTFKHKIKPYEHQDRLFKQTRMLEYYAFFWEMGLGKTKEALDTAAWLYHEGLIDALLVITYNGVHLNWVTKEIPEHLHENCNYKAIAWDSSRYSSGNKKFAKALDDVCQHDGLQILSVNVEAFARDKAFNYCVAFLKGRRVLCVVDESHAVKDPKAKRTKKILKLREHSNYRRIMTGTPVGNSPLDLYTQFAFLSPEILSFKSYYAFQARYAIMQPLRGVTSKAGRQVEIVVGYRDIDELKGLIEPYSSRLTKEECLDLPLKIPLRHPFVITDEQRRLYTELVEDTVTEFEGNRISTQMAITRMLRLHQITCGFIVHDDVEAGTGGSEVVGEQICKGQHPRMSALMDVLDQVHSKAIIWSTYRYSLREIYAAVTEKYGKGCAVGYSGATPQNDRPGIVKRFQEDPDCRFFIGQPKAGGTGITLTAARDVIYYSNDYSLITRLQSEDRAHRIGQEHAVTYTDLEAVNTIDSNIIEALKNKVSISAQITGDKLVEWLTD